MRNNYCTFKFDLDKRFEFLYRTDSYPIDDSDCSTPVSIHYYSNKDLDNHVISMFYTPHDYRNINFIHKKVCLSSYNVRTIAEVISYISSYITNIEEALAKSTKARYLGKIDSNNLHRKVFYDKFGDFMFGYTITKYYTVYRFMQNYCNGSGITLNVEEVVDIKYALNSMLEYIKEEFKEIL